MRQKETVFLYCQACSTKFIYDESVVEIKVNDVPGGIPFLDKEDNKVKMPAMMPRRRMFKCPKCGRGVASKMLTSPSREPTVVSDRSNWVDPRNPRA